MHKIIRKHSFGTVYRSLEGDVGRIGRRIERLFCDFNLILLRASLVMSQVAVVKSVTVRTKGILLGSIFLRVPVICISFTDHLHGICRATTSDKASVAMRGV